MMRWPILLALVLSLLAADIVGATGLPSAKPEQVGLSSERLESMTKPIVTVAALSLYEEGRILVSDPVSKHLPAFKGMQVGVETLDPVTGKMVVTTVPVDREMTIQDLMRHTSGITYGNRGK